MLLYPNRYHFIGIGGIGMSALARILLQQGASVSGSDVTTSGITEALRQLGAAIYAQHAEEHVQEMSTIVYSTDISSDNPEICAGKKKGCPLLHRSDLLWSLMREQVPLLVTGTHGKTTTSSLLAHLLAFARLHPTFAIGGIVKSLKTNGEYGTGSYFVAEADESDGSFLKYIPFGAIMTNIDGDHLNYWQTYNALIAGFRQFAHNVTSKEHLLWCGDDEALCFLRLPGISYGFEEKNDIRILSFRQNGWNTLFDMRFDDKLYLDVDIPLIGGHNVLNAASVFGMALRLNISEEEIRRAFSAFQGVGRRTDFKGECKSISAYDDYAHHPTEIFATLHAIKYAIDKRRLVVAFQPHRFSRTREFLTEFGPAFAPADVVVLTEIYSAGEMPITGVDTATLFRKIQENCKADVRYSSRANLTHFLTAFLKERDVLVTMGAGDVTKVGPEVLERL